MIRFRSFWDKDAEEIWLNEMAAKGYKMQRFFLFIYWFGECQPGEYVYQIDLLKDIKPAEKKEYIQLIEESGAKLSGQWFWWYYFCKPASTRAFELYTDAESKIEQYNRIYCFFRGAAFVETGILIFEIIILLWSRHAFSHGEKVFWWCMCVLIGLMASVLWSNCIKANKKIKKIEKEKW